MDKGKFLIDPSGVFHLETHHYNVDGLQHFSLLCELCIAASANSDGVVALSAINEEDEDDEDDDRHSG